MQLIDTKALALCVILLLTLSLPVFATSLVDLSYTITDDKVAVNLTFSEKTWYRVWMTRNPAKLHIDAPGVELADSIKSVEIGDAALGQIRAFRENNMARVLLEFNYEVPEPRHYWVDETTLIVEVDKRYGRSFEVILASGVTFGQSRWGTPAGPVIVNWVEVNPRLDVAVKPVLARDRLTGRETVSSMCSRHGAIAAVNGIYFASNGEPLGLLIMDGKLVSAPYFGRTAFGIDQDGKFHIDRVDYSGTVVVGDREIEIAGVNRRRFADELIVFTPEYGPTTRTNCHGLEVVVQDGVVTAIDGEGNAAIPSNGYVLSGHGQVRDLLAEAEVGQRVQASWRLEPDWLQEGIVQALGGGPRLVKDGRVYVTAKAERFRSDITVGRAPRTALGVTEDGKLLLVTVSGRRKNVTIGMTLTELAKLMIELGAVDAMNLDGGGSTTMVVRNKVLNLPSDGRERPVSNALLVLPGSE